MSGEVWVVDDDRTMVQALTALLDEREIPARGYCDPRSALESALRDAPRVIVTAVAMPALTGVELARELRAELGPRCPRLVLVTGSDVRRVELTLFDHVVQKPFRLDALVPKLRAWLAPPRATGRASSHVRLRSVDSRANGGRER